MAALAIGTAQFGLPYGVANRLGQVEASEVAAILERAFRAGIDTLDTAVAYGESESCLGRVGVSAWRVVTKLPPLSVDVAAVDEWVRAQVAGSLQRLGIARLEALLLHRSADLLGTHGSAYRDALDSVKANGYARRVGVSIYDPAELDGLWDTWQPDLVQAPFNVLDRRLERSGWLARLATHGVAVHARSAFLQGLLLLPPERRPAFFAPWAELLDRWAAWCAERAISPLEAALGFVLARPGIECVVVGLDSMQQLDEILRATVRSAPTPPPDLICEARDLLEPSRWKLG